MESARAGWGGRRRTVVWLRLMVCVFMFWCIFAGMDDVDGCFKYLAFSATQVLLMMSAMSLCTSDVAEINNFAAKMLTPAAVTFYFTVTITLWWELALSVRVVLFTMLLNLRCLGRKTLQDRQSAWQSLCPGSLRQSSSRTNTVFMVPPSGTNTNVPQQSDTFCSGKR